MVEFVFSEHIAQIITTCLLSMVPTFEGRYAVLTALALGMPAVPAYILAVVSSSLPVPVLLLLLDPLVRWALSWPIKPMRVLADKFITKAREKAQSMRKGSYWGLFIFVALPIPGTGVWTGSAIAVLLGLKKLPSAAIILLGNMTACLITTLIGTGALNFFGSIV